MRISIHYSFREPFPTVQPNISIGHYEHRIPKSCMHFVTIIPPDDKMVIYDPDILTQKMIR